MSDNQTNNQGISAKTKWTVNLSFSTVFFMFLAICLLGAVVVYQNINGSFWGNNNTHITNPLKNNSNFGGVYREFVNFNNSIKMNKGNVRTKEIHANFYQYLQELNSSELPSASQMKLFAKENDLLDDYKYFFTECMPNYKSYVPSFIGQPIKSQSILASFPVNSHYKASLYINEDNLTIDKLKNTFSVNNKNNGIVMTGTYSSIINMPAGLAANMGKIINPVIQAFDGLIIINSQGEITLTHIDNLQYDLRSLHIRSSFRDYQNFLKLIENNRLSVLQSHLFINNGELLIDDKQNSPKARRRLLFQTADNSVHVFDSQVKEMTLYEAANFIKANFKAIIAINLDMGEYNFCTVYSNFQPKDYSDLKKGVLLSNFIVIEQ